MGGQGGEEVTGRLKQVGRYQGSGEVRRWGRVK
jgi:hypothetical protein